MHALVNFCFRCFYIKPSLNQPLIRPVSDFGSCLFVFQPQNILRVCSTTAFFEKLPAQLATYLILRQCMEKQARRVINEVRTISRESLSTPSSQISTNRIPFLQITAISCQSFILYTIFRKYECLLRSDEHPNVFPEKPVIAYCRMVNNLKEMIVKSTLKPILPKPPKPIGFFNCNRHYMLSFCRV